jgi:uncharacterized protein (TIGR00369 family)
MTMQSPAGETRHSPKNPDYDQAVRTSFKRQNVMQTLGVQINNLSPGRIELEMPFGADFTQQHGFLHAGILTTALDSACGYAAYSLMPVEATVLTVEFKTNLMSPAQGERFLFRAGVLKAGRTLIVCEGKAWAVRDGQEKLIAAMTATLMAVQGHQEVSAPG